MDLYLLISVMSVMHSWIFSTALSAPAGGSPTSSSAVTPGRHVRTKRCSCATFMDKECVYFCHLDIIWVNTPERVVSYGLGNAPRTKRAAEVSMATGGGPRCRCSREGDTTCRNFCEADKHLRYESSADNLIDAHKQAAATQRTGAFSHKRGPPLALRAAVKSRLLLEKWRARQRHRARTWEGESMAS